MTEIPHPIPVAHARRVERMRDPARSAASVLLCVVSAILLFGALVLALSTSGCSTTAKQEQAVIDMGYHLVESWEPDGPNRAIAKQAFLTEARPFLSPSPSPSPAAPK
jgi:hypothetical protein